MGPQGGMSGFPIPLVHGLPQGITDSTVFCKGLLEKAGIVATPGVGFGAAGEGYIRFALTVPEAEIREAIVRMKKVLA